MVGGQRHLGSGENNGLRAAMAYYARCHTDGAALQWPGIPDRNLEEAWEIGTHPSLR